MKGGAGWTETSTESGASKREEGLGDGERDPEGANLTKTGTAKERKRKDRVRD